MTALSALLGLFPRLLLGFMILRQLRIDSLLLKMSLSAAVGFGVSSLASFLWLWLGLPIRQYALLETLLVLLCALWVTFPFRRMITGVRVFRKVNDPLWLLLFLASAAVFLFNLIMAAFQSPHGSMDAWMNWNVVSRFIANGGEDWQNTFLRSLGHPDYPFFVTISNALTWVILQTDTVWGPIALHFVFSLSTVGVLFSTLTRLRDGTQAYLASIVFMSQAFLAGYSMSQLADFPFAYLLLGAGAVTLLYLSDPSEGYPILAGFIAGLSVWTKNEGFVTVGGFLLLWGVIGKWKGWSSFWKFLMGLVPPLAVTILFKIFLAPPNDLVSGWQNIWLFAADLRRYSLIAREAARILSDVNEGYVLLIGLIISYGVMVGRSTRQTTGVGLMGAVILLQLAAYFVIYLTTPNDLDWHLRTSLNRLFLHVTPLAFLLFFVWVRSPQELKES